MPDSEMTLYTIGHSNHALERFLELLGAHRIDAVADVRSQPYSRFNPQFRKAPLAHALGEAGLRYVFLGRELGARPDDPAVYVDGRVSYRRLAATARFRRGIGRLCTGAQRFRVAVMCAEKDPADCHRTILVGRALVRGGVEVRHILADGTVESQSGTLRRLAQRLGIAADLLRGPDDLIEEVCRRQSERIACRRPAVD